MTSSPSNYRPTKTGLPRQLRRHADGRNDRFWRIVLKKSFWTDKRKFLGPPMRFVRGNVRDHIVTPKSTTALRSGTGRGPGLSAGRVRDRPYGPDAPSRPNRTRRAGCLYRKPAGLAGAEVA